MTLGTLPLLSQKSPDDLLHEYIWDSCFGKNQLSDSKTETISKSFFTKQPLKPIKSLDYKQENWKINKSGAPTLYMNTFAWNDSVIDTNVTWYSYLKDTLTSIKKTGIGGISVKTILYDNNKPIAYIYGNSKNESSSKDVLNLVSYSEMNKEIIEHIHIGDSIIIENHKSKDDVVFKTITEQKNKSRTKKSVHFPFSSENNWTVTTLESETIYRMSIQAPNTKNIDYFFRFDSKGRIANYETWNMTSNSKTHLTECIYDEINGNLKALVTKDLHTETIEIIKYKYSYYD